MTRVKEKFQVTIPEPIRKKARLTVGDYLEASIEGEAIVLKQKGETELNAIDAAIDEGLRAYKEGRVTPAFSNMKEYHEYRRQTKKKK